MTTKPFPPSARKLKKAREDGDFAQSKHLSKAIIFTAGVAYLYFASNDVQKLLALLIKSVSFGAISEQDIIFVLYEGFKLALSIIMPLIIVVSIASILANIVQVGVYWNMKKLIPDLKKFNPIKNLKNLFSISEQKGDGKVFCGKICYDFIKAIVVLILLSCVVYFIVCADVAGLFFPDSDDFRVLLLFSGILFKILMAISAILLLVGGFDLFLEKKRRYNRLRMDLEELKKELKENEGNPEIRGMRKQLHREILVHNLAQNVRKSRVLVVNK